MPVLQGNITGSINTVAYNIPCKIISGYLTNKTGGNVIVNLYVVTGDGDDRSIIPLNTTLISGSMWIIEENVILLSGYYLIITTNGSLDYYFSIVPL